MRSERRELYYLSTRS